MSSIGKSVGSLLGLTGELIREAPLSSAAVTSSAGLGVGRGALSFLDGLDITGEEGRTETIMRRKQADFQAMVRAREKQLQQLRLQNLARVAAMAPDVYHSVSAGRRLPKGAVAIGGRPRVDLLTQLADSMSGTV